MNLTEIVDLIPSILTGVSLTFITVLYAINKIKTVINAAKSGNLEDISNLASELIIKAESFVNFTGEQKKDYVMDKLEMACVKSKVTVDSEVLSDVIENIIDLTKQVNIK